MVLHKDSTRHNTVSAYNKLKQRVDTGEWDEYCFNKTIYEKSWIRMTVTCKIHGDFLISPDHLNEGRGCKYCTSGHKTDKQYRQELKIKTMGEIISLEKYKLSKTPILHKHLVCGLEWVARPTDFLSGCGCPSCASYGFDITKPAIVYYLKIYGGEAYKIGITNRTVRDRFTNSELENIEILKTWDYLLGSEAKRQEEIILERFSYAKYTGAPLLKSGNTELFYYDILDLDTKV